VWFRTGSDSVHFILIHRAYICDVFPTTVVVSYLPTLQQREDAVAYQVLREKHQMETEALLSALSDSQNLNKVLREENVRVREENTHLRRGWRCWKKRSKRCVVSGRGSVNGRD